MLHIVCKTPDAMHTGRNKLTIADQFVLCVTKYVRNRTRVGYKETRTSQGQNFRPKR